MFAVVETFDYSGKRVCDEGEVVGGEVFIYPSSSLAVYVTQVCGFVQR
jgi:hypothetical protein